MVVKVMRVRSQRPGYWAQDGCQTGSEQERSPAKALSGDQGGAVIGW